MNRKQVIAAALIWWASQAVLAEDHESSRASNFRRSVAPVLIRNCLECHQGGQPSGELDLSTSASLARGGESGVVVDGARPSESLLWEKIAEGEMPPEQALSAADRQTLLDWIAAGTPWDDRPIDLYDLSTEKRAGYDWWSLQRIVDPVVPAVDTTPSNAIDAFVTARLNDSGLSMAPRADARTLVRRLSVRLHGILPEPEIVKRFEREDSPEAFARLADEFLQSPRYGERWARHWLDLARFGESQGFERDKSRPNAWPYRDWVINALNADMPYDEFARLQIAGDCIPGAGNDGVIATGFLVACGWDEVGHKQQSGAMKAIVRQDEMEDYVGTVGQTFLALTTNCARCHDHKFDPIRQTEYYRLASALDGVRPGDRDITAGKASAESDRVFVYAVSPAQPAEPTRLLLRGNTKTPGKVVSPGGLAALRGTNADFALPPDAPEAERRRKLARWITRAENPLFARVIVNRLWQHHFGVPLVETPNDFGFSGGRPSHPELLDFLASRLIESGWSLKTIQRLIVTSATWQQAVIKNPSASQMDADNRLLWRGNRMRLDAETLRDSILQVAGQLNNQVGGPSFQDFRTFTFNSQFYEMLDPVGADFNRRTIYRMVIRSGRNRLLDAFDCPDPSATAPRRSLTTTPLQSLSLMNHSFVLRMSDEFARRVGTEAGDDARAATSRAVELVWSRTPDPAECESFVKFVNLHGMPALCRVLFNSNEFLYVD